MTALEAYERMVLIRRFEEAVERLFLEGKFGGTAHTCIGQEAVAVGVASALHPEDGVTSTHRGHGHFLARGGEARRMLAEIAGRADGYSRGRGGSQMMADLSRGFYGANGITAGSTAFAAGLALAARQQGSSRVMFCFLGDGASNQGLFAETLNLAALWKLPVVYVVENNGYAMSTATARGLANTKLVDRAAAFGIHAAMRVDGNDYFAVASAAAAAREWAAAGAPALLECVTYRLSGHSRGDPRVYRTREEEGAAWARDPLVLLKSQLLAGGTSTEICQAAETRAAQHIDEAIAAALSGGVDSTYGANALFAQEGGR